MDGPTACIRGTLEALLHSDAEGTADAAELMLG